MNFHLMVYLHLLEKVLGWKMGGLIVDEEQKRDNNNQVWVNCGG